MEAQYFALFTSSFSLFPVPPTAQDFDNVAEFVASSAESAADIADEDALSTDVFIEATARSVSAFSWTVAFFASSASFAASLAAEVFVVISCATCFVLASLAAALLDEAAALSAYAFAEDAAP